MSEITRVVCDACERGGTATEKLVKLEMQTRGDGGFSIIADVHNTTRCISRAVRRMADRHFTAIEDKENTQAKQDAAASASAAASQKPKQPEPAKPAEVRQPVVAKR